jgi:glucose/arabinose dehydrogenase
MRRLVITCVTALLLAAGATAPSPARAATAAPGLELTRIVDLGGTTAMTARHGTRTLYVADQRGVVRAIRNRTVARTPVVDLSARVSQDGGERGLLGLTFSPDGKQLYVNYTDTNGDTQIDELTMQGKVADPASRRNVLEVDQPQPNHNGGQLAFGPDGYLYIGLGDGGASGDVGAGHAPGGNGQSLETLLGKVLRIDPTPSADAAYTVPPDNPFVGDADVRPEIWAYGLRNPWRFSFDRESGDLWIGDVGQDEFEEIDHVPATDGRDAGKGDNFGWNRLEGDHPYRGTVPDGVVAPVHEIAHDTGACAVVGGYVYRGGTIPGLTGDYLFSDNCDGTIRILVPDGEGGVTMHDSGITSEAVSSFGQGNGGALYVLSQSEGIFRVDAA